MSKERTILVLDGLEPLQWGPGVQQGKLKVDDLKGLTGDKVQAHSLGHLSPEAGAELLKARGAKGTDEELLVLVLVLGFSEHEQGGELLPEAPGR